MADALIECVILRFVFKKNLRKCLKYAMIGLRLLRHYVCKGDSLMSRLLVRLCVCCLATTFIAATLSLRAGEAEDEEAIAAREKKARDERDAAKKSKKVPDGKEGDSKNPFTPDNDPDGAIDLNKLSGKKETPSSPSAKTPGTTTQK